MELKKVTDLSYTERTLLGKFRLCTEEDKAAILAQIQALHAQQEDGNIKQDTPEKPKAVR